ncbi:MAG: hypothetical protein IPM60_09280 [Rhodospirillales bacterium]|nr:hypothetical protein [Rhodospirillales bacterium]
MRSVYATAAAMVAVLGVTACGDGEPEVADIPYDQVRAAMEGDAAAWRSYSSEIKGKTVRWTGRMVRAERVRGDDYVEEGEAYIDMDADGQGSPAPDVVLQIPVSQVDALNTPERPVTFRATILGFVPAEGGQMIEMNLKELAE